MDRLEYQIQTLWSSFNTKLQDNNSDLLQRYASLQSKVAHLEKGISTLDSIDICPKLDKMAICVENLEGQQALISKIGQWVSALENVDLSQLTTQVEQEVKDMAPRLQAIEKVMKETTQKVQALDTKMMKEMLSQIDTQNQTNQNFETWSRKALDEVKKVIKDLSDKVHDDIEDRVEMTEASLMDALSKNTE